MQNAPIILIRPYEETNAPFLAAIFFNTIHNINAKDYSLDQLNAWAPKSCLETEGWINKWRKLSPMIASVDNKIVGFVELEKNGHIDCFYCHHEHQGCGIGSALLKAVESQARSNENDRIFADVSITAKPFFKAKGFHVIKEQTVHIRGVMLKNFVMEKIFK